MRPISYPVGRNEGDRHFHDNVILYPVLENHVWVSDSAVPWTFSGTSWYGLANAKVYLMSLRTHNLRKMLQFSSIFNHHLSGNTMKCSTAGQGKEEWMKRKEVQKKERHRTYAIEKVTTDEIKDCINKQRRYTNSVVLECCGDRKIYMCKDRKELHLGHLQQDANLSDLYTRMDDPKNRNQFPSPLEEYFEATMGRQLHEDEPVLIIGVISPTTQLKHLYNIICAKEGLLKQRRLELFLVLTGSNFMSLMFPKAFTPFGVISDTLFDKEYVHKIQKNSIVPKLKTKFQRKIFDEKVDNQAITDDYNYLVHLVLNDKVRDVLSPERLEEFTMLLSLLHHRECTLVSAVERWIPNSGPQLLRKGYTMGHKVKHLTPTLCYNLFLELMKLPNYEYHAKKKDNQIRKLTKTGYFWL